MYSIISTVFVIGFIVIVLALGVTIGAILSFFKVFESKSKNNRSFNAMRKNNKRK